MESSTSLADLTTTSSIPPVWSIKTNLSQRGLWIFIVVAIITIIIVICIARDGIVKSGNSSMHSFYESLNMYSWGRNTIIWSIIMVVGILLFGWATYTAYVSIEDNSRRNMVIAGFLISMLLIIAMFAIFFRKNSNGQYNNNGFISAAWIATFAMIVGFLTLWPMWSNNAAKVGMIPYIIWILATTILFWNIARENPGDV